MPVTNLNKMLQAVLALLRDELISFDSFSLMVLLSQVTIAYATHFIEMFVDKHMGKHNELAHERGHCLNIFPISYLVP